MTLPTLLTHVAARWAVTRTPTCGWTPNESETDMPEPQEWETAGDGCECWVNPYPWTYYGMTERTYTLADMARAWREGKTSEWLTRRHIETGEGHPGDPNPYEQEEA